MNDNNNNAGTQREPEYFSLKDFFNKCVSSWKWFVISVIVCILFGGFYCIIQQPSYLRYTEVLVKDQDGAGGADFSSAFSAFGLSGSNTSVNNELISFQSPAIMYEVVKRLNLTMNYKERKLPHGVTLYASTLPYLVDFPDLDPEQGASMRMAIEPNGQMTLYKFRTRIDNKKIKYDDKVSVAPGQTMVKTPLGRVTIIPNPRFSDKIEEPMEIGVSRWGTQVAVEIYCKKLKVDLVDQDAEVIKLSITDVSKTRANDILSTIIAIYNENWVQNKNIMAVSTSKFIDDRLKVIESELGDVDNDISTFQATNRVIDPKQMADAQISANATIEDNILKLNNELAMTGYIRDYLANPANKFNVVPVNTGFGSQQLEAQIANYNQLLLARNNLVDNSSESNPIAVGYDNQLYGMREAIVNAVAAHVSQLNASLRTMKSAHAETQGQLASTPAQAKYLQSVGRQQRVKESLYLYLLEKREENELSQSFTAYNTRIITPPSGPLDPAAPKVVTILFIAFAIGLIIPALWVYIKNSSDTKVRSRKDLEHAGVPFAGELPIIHRQRTLSSLFASSKKKREEAEKPLDVVKEGERDIANEAFRVVRSNLEFMMGRNSGPQVVMLTSFNPGSGKSFISYNLAKSFALKGKKTLLIDADLRRGTASSYAGSPSKGLTTYLTENSDNWRSLVKDTDVPLLKVMGMGPVPPNPAELLDSQRFETLMKEVREDYDVVLIDCPPTDIVVDTQIVAQQVDRTIFVVRAGLFDKRALVEVESMYADKKYRNMCLVLNGTDTNHSRFAAYGSNGTYGNK